MESNYERVLRAAGYLGKEPTHPVAKMVQEAVACAEGSCRCTPSIHGKVEGEDIEELDRNARR